MLTFYLLLKFHSDSIQLKNFSSGILLMRLRKEIIVAETKMNHFAEQVQQAMKLSMETTVTKFDEVYKVIHIKVLRDWLVESLSTCLSRKVPTKLVPARLQYKELTKLHRRQQKQNITCAISLERLWELFQLPLKDRIFTETRAVVTINVPIHRSVQVWKLYEFHVNKVCISRADLRSLPARCPLPG